MTIQKNGFNKNAFKGMLKFFFKREWGVDPNLPDPDPVGGVKIIIDRVR